MAALKAELKMLCHRSGQHLDYVKAHGASLVERLDNACAMSGTSLTSAFIVGLLWRC
jgi:hypothetical protein